MSGSFCSRSTTKLGITRITSCHCNFPSIPRLQYDGIKKVRNTDSGTSLCIFCGVTSGCNIIIVGILLLEVLDQMFQESLCFTHRHILDPILIQGQVLPIAQCRSLYTYLALVKAALVLHTKIYVRQTDHRYLYLRSSE